jgi:hypothetical protein
MMNITLMINEDLEELLHFYFLFYYFIIYLLYLFISLPHTFSWHSQAQGQLYLLPFTLYLVCPASQF